MLRLARDLGRTLEEILEMSTLEFNLWIAFYTNEHQERTKQMRKQKNGRR